ncbi:hypothetical protein B1218_36940, partial [Pseudomonas ogarae]
MAGGAGRRTRRSRPPVAGARVCAALDCEALAAMGAVLGHGGVVVPSDGLGLARLARSALRFWAEESGRKCARCRIGSTRGVEVVGRLVANTEAGDGDQAIHHFHPT